MEERPFPAWSLSVEQCLKEYNVELVKGLSSYEVERQRDKCGWNELAEEKGKPLWRLVLEQFDDMLVKILLVVAFISFILANMHVSESQESGFEAYVEPFVIVLILVLNAIVGVWQETNAEKAIEPPKEMQCESGKVLRDGYLVPDLPSQELVPGDIVELQVGDKVHADMRIAALKTTTLRLEQSALTGEAMPVLKEANTRGLSGRERHTFEKEGSRLTTAIGLVCLVVWLINYKNFFSWDMVDGWLANLRFSFEKCTYYFKIVVALAVAAIPEGLPAVITTSFALGTRKMAQKNAIVRSFLVSKPWDAPLICSDKTGTLSTNQMSVVEFFILGGKTTTSRIFHVEGTTYDPKDGGIVDWTCYNMDANLQVMAEIYAVCNDAGIFCDGRLYRATGLPTEPALKVLVEKMGVPDAKMRNKIRDSQLVENYLIDRSTVKLGCCEWWTKRSKRLATLEFDRVRKSLSIIGAVDSLLERSTHVQLADGSLVPMDEFCGQLLLSRNSEMSSKGLRCLGLAYKDELGEFSDYSESSCS
ncbi:Calcium-transporting ATPase 2, endoplasmic reticulum-type [Hibiscus syriacus]|uniref:Calcium-transporting ATPase 2, endoplasmic reticulum-type n=1 Tax=Hibiscus syriacus TaxID=106335 RepID=A0A6A3AV99_HIBSY|nr:Calcium-transporting ATPase 2, endoplasmic reticulum-type [Hibiscus syriacus]